GQRNPLYSPAFWKTFAPDGEFQAHAVQAVTAVQGQIQYRYFALSNPYKFKNHYKKFSSLIRRIFEAVQNYKEYFSLRQASHKVVPH
ncbi:MAG: hypothetical protein Q8L02_07180, partial [Candidatus Nitrotoga sp.]|nr:hypothetical protein [Candidatus Nitrotoga sp.]